MRRIAQRIAEAVLVVCVLMLLAVLSPALLICALVFDEDDPAESYRRFW